MARLTDHEFDALRHFADIAFSHMAEVGFDQLPKHEKTFICVWSLSGEVDNGGFEQFYFNSSGDQATAVPAELRQIGADAMADIVSRANALFGSNGPPSDLSLRRELINSLPDRIIEQFHSFDTEYYAQAAGLDTLLYNYLRATMSSNNGE